MKSSRFPYISFHVPVAVLPYKGNIPQPSKPAYLGPEWPIRQHVVLRQKILFPCSHSWIPQNKARCEVGAKIWTCDVCCVLVSCGVSLWCNVTNIYEGDTGHFRKAEMQVVQFFTWENLSVIQKLQFETSVSLEILYLNFWNIETHGNNKIMDMHIITSVQRWHITAWSAVVHHSNIRHRKSKRPYFAICQNSDSRSNDLSPCIPENLQFDDRELEIERSYYYYYYECVIL
jgi:hypothetical protein